MKRIFVLGLLITTTILVSAQKVENIINAKEAERIERVLSSDDMRGRKTFSPEIDKAADFIADENNYSDWQTVECIINFIQSMKYRNDGTYEYPRYPIETLVDFEQDQGISMTQPVYQLLRQLPTKQLL